MLPSVMSDSLRPHGLYPTRLLCPWNSPAKNTRVGIPYSTDLPNPEMEPGSLALQILYHLSHQGSPNRNHYDRLSQKWKL